jgi:hypothetical protein
MLRRLPLVLSITALVVAVAGITPLGEAAREATNVVRFARNADKVDGIHASRSPKAGRLLALNSSRKFPASVLTGAVTGLELVTISSALDASTPKVVVINCPAGKRAIAGAHAVTGAGASEISVTESFPSGTTGTQWTIRGVEVNAAGSWRLQGWAVCAAVS